MISIFLPYRFPWRDWRLTLCIFISLHPGRGQWIQTATKSEALQGGTGCRNAPACRTLSGSGKSRHHHLHHDLLELSLGCKMGPSLFWYHSMEIYRPVLTTICSKRPSLELAARDLWVLPSQTVLLRIRVSRSTSTVYQVGYAVSTTQGRLYRIYSPWEIPIIEARAVHENTAYFGKNLPFNDGQDCLNVSCGSSICELVDQTGKIWAIIPSCYARGLTHRPDSSVTFSCKNFTFEPSLLIKTSRKHYHQPRMKIITETDAPASHFQQIRLQALIRTAYSTQHMRTTNLFSDLRRWRTTEHTAHAAFHINESSWPSVA